MTVNNYVDKITSPLIPSQFPAFYEDQGPNFIAFVQAYYQWLEQANTYLGSTTYQTRSLLENFDVDRTANNLIKHFSNEYLINFPQKLAIDHPFIIKHILDFYRTKGSARGIELLFRILYNIDSQVNIPGKYMFRTSNATWKIPHYIETTDSPYLIQLTGQLIRSSGGASAVVETVNQKMVNNRTINIIYLSSLDGDFRNGDLVFCDAIPQMVDGHAPIIIGSLTTVSVNGGGSGFSVGDEVAIAGTGTGGLARIAAVVSENGKVSFQLVDGGYGYSLGAAITIDNSGTGGGGASFRIGAITDVQNISLSTDTISGIIATQMDLSTSGDTVGISGISGGPFLNNELAAGSAWTRDLQVNYIQSPNGLIANGEALSNSTLGISGVIVYISDGQQLYCTGTSGALNNANIAYGSVLVSNTSVATVQIAGIPTAVTNTFANGLVISAGSNSTVLAVHRNDGADIGYYVPGMALTGNISGATATVVGQTRLTNWQFFPVASFGSSLDTPLGGALTFINKQIGKIAYLNNENPGDGYASAPAISIVEPLIYELRVVDGKGGFWGDDAIVTATAGSANGIATAVSLIDSGFGYQPNESLVLSNANNITAIFGKAVVLSSGFGKGHWTDTQGFLSDEMVLQDSFYYQVFSYEIEAEKMIDVYRNLVKQLAHPVGYALFGKFVVDREFPKISGKLVDSTISQKPIEIPLTADDTIFSADVGFITADETGYLILSGISNEIDNESYAAIMTEANSYIMTDGSYLQSNT
jgi:hypothetical protein